MAAAPTPMDVDTLKRLLNRSKTAPVFCAVAHGYDDSAGLALLLLDRVVKPRALAKQLQEQFPDSKKIRFGEATAEGKLVTLTLNKPSPGLEKKLIRTIRGTGFNKADVTDEKAAKKDDKKPEAADEKAKKPAR